MQLDAGIRGTYNPRLSVRSDAGRGVGQRGRHDRLHATISYPGRYRREVRWREDAATWNHTTSTVAPKVKNYDTFNLLIGYDINNRIGVSFDVRNLFNEDPPFVDTTTGYDPQSSNPIPRLFAVTANVKF